MDESNLWEKTVYQLKENEIDTIQLFRSDQRKSRTQKLPILISILKEINNSSNLFDLAIRYEKYKTKEQTISQKEEQYNELMMSISFQQTKCHINPYQDAQKKQTLQISDQKNGQFKNIINLLEATYLNIQSDLAIIQQENKTLKQNINTYFDSLWTSSLIKNTEVNELNYGFKDRQEHYQGIQLCIPTMEKEKQELINLKQKQEVQIQNQSQDLEIFNAFYEKYYDQQNYISQLKLAQQQLENQVSSLSDRIKKLKQAQEVMNLETKFEQFCDQILALQNEGRSQIFKNFIDFIEKIKLKLMRNHKEKTEQTYLCQDMIEFEEQILRQEMQEFCQNKNEQESKIKTLKLKQIFQEKIQKVRIEQQRLQQENFDLAKNLQILSSNQFQQKLKGLQDLKEQLQKENILKEKEIMELQQINQAGQLMVEDLEKQIIKNKNKNQKQQNHFRRKNKLLS